MRKVSKFGKFVVGLVSLSMIIAAASVPLFTIGRLIIGARSSYEGMGNFVVTRISFGFIALFAVVSGAVMIGLGSWWLGDAIFKENRGT